MRIELLGVQRFELAVFERRDPKVTVRVDKWNLGRG
jgi:hypothetical protein